MSAGLIKVTESQFGPITCDYYGDLHGEFYMTRRQIGEALEYDDPRKAIQTLHDRHKERLDKFSTVLTLRTADGKKRDVFLYSARGVYEILRWSRQPKADEFYDHVYDILEGLRQGWLKLEAEKQTAEWQSARIGGKATRRLETDAIKSFVSMAEEQGSRNADRYYTAFSKLANKTVGIDSGMRDSIPFHTLTDLSTIERVINNAISEEVAAGTEYHDAYKAVRAKVEQVAELAVMG